jgi:site-specific recombinase XerC
MAEKDALRRVCQEPLLYAFQAPRTIAATLSEYEQHLRHERALSPRRVRATLRSLTRFLEPLEAPLVALTPELARAMMLDEEAQQQAQPGGSLENRCLTLPRTRRFFRWAVQLGYVNRNPFEEFEVGVVIAPPHEWLA